MALTVTQTNFRQNFEYYVQKVTDEQEIIYIRRPQQKGVTLISQDRLDWLERYAKSEPGTLKHSIAAEHLMDMSIIPQQGRRISTDKDYNEFWDQFNK